MEQIAQAEQSGYGGGRALSGHNSDRPAASAQHECAVCDGVFHERVLCRLPEDRSDESVDLLQNADGAG